MEKQPLVSIIVPVYNGTAYLPRCIESITQQTYKNLEILLIDNAATNDCLSICEKYARQDSRVKIVHLSKNVGPTGARAAGITACTGDWVGFCDSDDWFEQNAVETLLNLHQQTGAEIVWGQVNFHREGHPPYNPKIFPLQVNYQHLDSEDILACYSWNCWDKLYSRRLIEKELQFDTSLTLGEDTDFIFHAIQLTNFTAFTQQPVYNYAVLPSSVSHTPNIARLLSSLQPLRQMYQFCKDKHLTKALPNVTSVLTSIQSLVLIDILLYDLEGRYSLSFKQTLQFLRANTKNILINFRMGCLGKCFMLFLLTAPHITKVIFQLKFVNPPLRKILYKRLHSDPTHR